MGLYRTPPEGGILAELLKPSYRIATQEPVFKTRRKKVCLEEANLAAEPTEPEIKRPRRQREPLIAVPQRPRITEADEMQREVFALDDALARSGRRTAPWQD